MRKKEGCEGMSSDIQSSEAKADVQSDLMRAERRHVLKTLLQDKTSKRNILWATDTYAELGPAYSRGSQITPALITGKHSYLIRSRAQKRQEQQSARTKAHAEVFTPLWVCAKMNDVIDEEWFGTPHAFFDEQGRRTDRVEFPQGAENAERAEAPEGAGSTERAEASESAKGAKDARVVKGAGRVKGAEGRTWRDYVKSRRLEITCGEAPYLVSRYDVATGEPVSVEQRVGILDRKLRVVDENAQDEGEWLRWALRAMESTYGYEFQGDNLLIARLNILATFEESLRRRWHRDATDTELRKVANIIAWNIWQMDGLSYRIPFSDTSDDAIDLFEAMGVDDAWGRPKPAERTSRCRVYNWSSNRSQPLVSTEGKATMKFDYIIGNPPYQEETSDSVSKTNGQKPVKNIFQYFQNAADDLTENVAVLIYPGGRWIHQSGKGMKIFGKNQINDKHLSIVDFYPDASELFGNAASLSDGITIVTKNYKKTTDGFTYVYSQADEEFSIHVDNPGDKLLPLDPHDLSIEQKINAGVKKNGLSFLHDSILPRSLFSIESDFAEKNPSKVRRYSGSNDSIDFTREIKLLTNDKAGKAGRATWFVTNKDVITRNSEYITQWQVVVSSANAGGQKRDNQLEIIDNHSAFGRSRLALRSFPTYEEAKHFYDYVSSIFIRYTFLLTDEALTSLGKEVPDFQDYTDENPYVDFSKNIDIQLCQFFNISNDEFAYMKNRVTSLRGEE